MNNLKQLGLGLLIGTCIAFVGGFMFGHMDKVNKLFVFFDDFHAGVEKVHEGSKAIESVQQELAKAREGVKSFEEKLERIFRIKQGEMGQLEEVEKEEK